MKNRFQRTLKRLSHQLLPAKVLKHQIALRNWRRGEPEIRVLKALVPPGRGAIDVGAYLGAYTYFLARLSPVVHAFEPQPECFQFLSKAYAAPVMIHQCALSNQVGKIGMTHANDVIPNQGASLISGEKSATRHFDDLTNVLEVDVQKLDNFALANIGFIKIDAEGEETNVLLGAQQLISQQRPVLLIEVEQRHREEDVSEVFRSIESLGYAGEFLLDNTFRSLKDFSIDQHQRARLAGDKTKPYINNFIFRPV